MDRIKLKSLQWFFLTGDDRVHFLLIFNRNLSLWKSYKHVISLTFWSSIFHHRPIDVACPTKKSSFEKRTGNGTDYFTNIKSLAFNRNCTSASL